MALISIGPRPQELFAEFAHTSRSRSTEKPHREKENGREEEKGRKKKQKSLTTHIRAGQRIRERNAPLSS